MDAAKDRKGGLSRASLWRQVGDGLRLMLGDPVLRALAGSAGIFALCGNMLGVVQRHLVRAAGRAGRW
jgi:hypothetical protein